MSQTPRAILREHGRLERRVADARARLQEAERQRDAHHKLAVKALTELDDTVVRWHGMELSLGVGVKVRAVPDSATLTAELIGDCRRDLLMPNYPALRSLAGHDELPDLQAVEASKVAQVNAKRRGSRQRSKGGE